MGYDVEIYETLDGKRPFEKWISKLKDYQGAATIKIRLRRITLGNFGDSKFVGSGVYELRIHYGPGYRIYYGRIDNKIVLLLCGGDKGSQESDIKTAKYYLDEFIKRRK